MKIRISYTFYTDRDYSLRNEEYFGCTGREVTLEEITNLAASVKEVCETEFEDEYCYDYVGSKEFEDEDRIMCKIEAKGFLEEMLCDGIHVSHSRYWLLKRFYNIIEELMNFINENDSGEYYETIGGNQEGTMIMVEIVE